MRTREDATRRPWGAVPVMVAALLLPAASPAGAAGQESVDTMGLGEVVEAALARNRQIRAARHRLDEASERVTEAWGSLYPSLDLSTTYTRNLSPAVNFLPAVIFGGPEDELLAVQFGADNQWNAMVSVEQPLFNGTAVIAVGAAGRYEALQEEIVRGEVQRVVTSVRQTYYDLLLAQEQGRLLENSVRRVRESLEETRALERAGLASDYDVLRLEVELANLEPNLLRARNAVRQARRELAVMIDVEDPQGIAVRGSLATMDILEPSANSADNLAILTFSGVELEDEVTDGEVRRLVDIAAGSRSDVRQLELTESLRKAEMRVEQVTYLPKVSLFGNYSINASQNGEADFFGHPRAYGRQAGVQVTVPIFQGFQRDARVDQKRAVMRAAEVETALARDLAESEVRTLVDRVEEARVRARGQVLAVRQATRGFEIARAQFAEGLGSRLELIDAEVALRQSEFNYAEAVYDFLVARSRLDEATGRVPLGGNEGGWTGAGGAPAGDGTDDTEQGERNDG